MKFKILKIEVASQFLLTIACLLFYLYVFLITDEHHLEIIYWGLLLLIGVFNLIGLVIRLFVVRSKLNFIYLFILLTFFILSFALYFFLDYDFERDVDDFMIYLFLLGSLFNIYYLSYGYLLIKNGQPISVGNKS